MSSELALTKEQMVTEYHHLLARKILILAISIIGTLLVVGFLSLHVYDQIPLAKTYEIIWNHICGNPYPTRSAEWWADLYIWQIAMPHIVAAIVAGASLAVCGALMQALMTNPLADPYSTGISSGACFGAVVAIVLGMSFVSVAGEMGIVGNAFIGAMIPAIIIILLAEKIEMTPATLILVGTAISYFFNSMVTYLMVITDADTLQSAYLWQIGSLDNISWSDIPLMLGVTVFGSVLVMLASHELNVMSLGDKSAISLGIDVHKFRILCLALMAVMTAAIVCFTGILGFVGLVAPHLVRLFIGSDNKYVIPISISVGAFLLLIADYVAMMVSNIPVGVIMGLIGSPVFFALIVWQRKSSGAIY